MEETTAPDVPLEPCVLIRQVPCNWISFHDEICEECEELMKQQQSNREIHFHAYQLYNPLRFGVIHKFNHRHLPVCVHSEITGSYPDPSHQHFGFLASMNDATLDLMLFNI